MKQFYEILENILETKVDENHGKLQELDFFSSY